MNKKSKLGKVVKQFEGYNIRIVLKDNSGKKQDSGTFAVCGGKTVKVDGLKNVDDAVSYIIKNL